MNFADLSPGVLGIIIWSLVSYFINKSKNKNNKEEAPFIDKNDSSQNTGFQFDSILDPQNSQSILNFDSNEVPLVQDEPVFDDFDKDAEIEHISVASSENINEEVYDNLIKSVHQNLEPLYKYFDLRKRLLDLDDLIAIHDYYLNELEKIDHL